MCGREEAFQVESAGHAEARAWVSGGMVSEAYSRRAGCPVHNGCLLKMTSSAGRNSIPLSQEIKGTKRQR